MICSAIYLNDNISRSRNTDVETHTLHNTDNTPCVLNILNSFPNFVVVAFIDGLQNIDSKCKKKTVTLLNDRTTFHKTCTNNEERTQTEQNEKKK